MNELVTQFFTLTGMIIFFLGVASACVWHIIKQRYIGHREPTSYRTLGMICGVAALVFIGMQNTNLAAQVQQCQKEFSERLTTRAAIGDDNDALSREHRYWLEKSDEAVTDLVKLTWMPDDPAIAKLDLDDPARRAYTSALVAQFNLRTQRYRVEMDRITTQQQQKVNDRAAHPLPPPNCGAN
jgi:hypothetical protein